jgi:hypothetical protein
VVSQSAENDKDNDAAQAELASVKASENKSADQEGDK